MERNSRWAKRVNSADPTFFPRHFPGQRPEILWIGCEFAQGDWRRRRKSHGRHLSRLTSTGFAVLGRVRLRTVTWKASPAKCAMGSVTDSRL